MHAMESRQLRYFCEIAEAGSFTAAAARLHIAQPALSRQIAALERDLGAPVFQRGPGGIKLTSHGEILLRHADAMRVHAARAREEISASLGHVTSWVSFGTAPALGRMIFGRVAEVMASRYPELRISFVEGVGASLLNSLGDRTLDLALTSRSAYAPGIEFRKMFSEPVYLVAAPGQKMPVMVAGWDDLRGIPLVVTNQQTSVASWVEELSGDTQTALDLRYRVESSHAAIDIMRRGLAFAVLPQSTMQDADDMEDFQRARLTEVSLDRNLAFLRERGEDPVMDVLCEVVEAEVHRHFPSQSGVE
jgi:LysR family nitrogen assimilation transcriptional regulator